MPTVDEVLRVARSWKGTPFAHQGRQKHVRCDCIGLVIEVCREVGLVEAAGLPDGWDHVGYGRLPESYGLTMHLLAYLAPVPRQAMRAGDIALFRATNGLPAHMGFVADGATPFSLIHAFNARTQRQAKVQEHRFGAQWGSRLHSVYRLPLNQAAFQAPGSQSEAGNIIGRVHG